MCSIALVGYSGHAYVVADIIEVNRLNLIGYYEKIPKKENPFNLKYLGTETKQEDLKILATEDHYFFVGIGLNKIRKHLMEMLFNEGYKTIQLCHPFTSVSKHSTVGSGTLIAAGVKVNALANVGKGVILNTGSVVEHECTIGDYSHVAPGAVLAGNVTIGKESFIGANSVVKEGITIGNNVTIGAGTVVLKDIPDNEIWVGNPGKRLVANGK